ncbi:MAG TPA: branched-chain amino acid ABC transporter permease [Actinomycetota bacterium]|nr:branched-chain amino acid ABC transporter permease [Actinomycetota bacterium]
MAALAPTVTESLAAPQGRFRPGSAGVAARVVASVVIAGGVLALPLLASEVRDNWIALAAIYGVIGLSINVITGHAGQLSLGHQAFVGIGAFMAAFVAAQIGGYFPDPENPTLPPLAVATTNFWLGLVAAGVVGAIMALLLGVVALRIRGLYLALITLAFGLMAENTIFGIRGFTGAGAGLAAPRPAMFASHQAYAYLCLGVLALFLYVDWRLVRSKGGRGIVALRNEERIAATLGVNVTAYKLLAFATAGLMAGVAGALFAHWNQRVQALDFELQVALVWILMAVVGGLGSRAGVVIGSAFFAVFPLALGDWTGGVSLDLPLVGLVIVETVSPLIGALLLLLTITLYPGGIGQQILPFRRWFAGGPLVESRHEAHRLAAFPALLGLIVGMVMTVGELGWLFGLLIGLAAAAALAVASVLGLQLYLAAYHRAQRVRPTARPAAEVTAAGAPEATAPVPEAVLEEVEAREGASSEPAAAPAGGPLRESADGTDDAGASQRLDDEAQTRPIDATRGTRAARFRRRRG